MRVDLFDKKSVKNCIKQLQAYSKTLNRKTKLFVRRVGELGIQVANTYIAQYNIPSEVIGQLKLQKGDVAISGSTIQIIVSNDEALFWEYGTGIVGKNTPHPETDMWIYDMNGHGQKGWVYVGGQLTEWSKEVKSGVFYTKGMESQPFMYNTFLDLQYSQFDAISNIAREVFSV